jgi:hypothetical protein
MRSYECARVLNEIARAAFTRKEIAVTVRIEKKGAVWTVIHDRPEARNAMDPESADALTAAFLEFDATRMRRSRSSTARADRSAPGGTFKYVSTLNAEYPLGELDIPPLGRRAMAARFRAVPWDPRASSSTSPSSARSRDRRSRAAWSSASGATSA